jgi:hypothetical protein
MDGWWGEHYPKVRKWRAGSNTDRIHTSHTIALKDVSPIWRD